MNMKEKDVMRKVLALLVLVVALVGCGKRETPLAACERVSGSGFYNQISENVVFCYADNARDIDAVLVFKDGEWQETKD